MFTFLTGASAFIRKHLPMVRNFLTVALRNLRRERGYTLLNVLGLTVGITSALFILLYVTDELSFDRYHAHAGRIYRISTHFTEQDDAFTWPSAQVVLTDELQEKYPDAEHVVRLIGAGRELFTYEQQAFYEEEFYYTDPDIFNVFSYEITAGDAATALRAPFTAVLTETAARRYFGNADPLGKTLRNGGDVYTVRAVMADVPRNSHYRFEGLLSVASLPDDFARNRGGWGGWGVATYVLLRAGVTPARFTEVLRQVNDAHVKPIFESFGVSIRYFLEPLTDIHLVSDIGGETEASGNVQYVRIFAGVALIMLLLACINYMNLATARSARRAREVGIRKTLGSTRALLVGQFLSESVVVAVVAVVFSVVMVALLMPFFNAISGKDLHVADLGRPVVLGGLLLILLLVGLLSGSYPAFVLSGFDPVRTLKGNGTANLASGGRGLRRALVVVQFAASVVLLVSTWVVYDQLSYLRGKDLGYDPERLIYLELPDQAQRDNYPALRQELLNLSGVARLASSNTKPGNSISKNLISVESETEGRVDRGVNMYQADHDYLATVGVPLVAGRYFRPDDTLATLVNESMVARMGWREPLGRKVYTGTDNDAQATTVVGVVRDYHQLSLYETIAPLAIFYGSNGYFVHIRLGPGDPAPTLAAIGAAWGTVNPGSPFAYTFLDQDFEEQFSADRRRGVVFGTFAGLTVLIAALGLLGLVSYTTAQRTREIGVRKVLGAETRQVVYLIAREFMGLVGVALLIALPLAGWLSYRWLQDFVYATHLRWTTFAAVAVVTFVLTLLTVSYHTLRAAAANPVRSLRAG